MVFAQVAGATIGIITVLGLLLHRIVRRNPPSTIAGVSFIALIIVSSAPMAHVAGGVEIPAVAPTHWVDRIRWPEKEHRVKYLILIHNNPAVIELFAGMTDDERSAAYQIYWDVEAELESTGELVDSKALDTGAQKLVNRGPQGPVVTDAPLPEVIEVVSGYYLVDVADEARAAVIAAKFPEAAATGGIRIARVWTEADFAANT